MTQLIVRLQSLISRNAITLHAKVLRFFKLRAMIKNPTAFSHRSRDSRVHNFVKRTSKRSAHCTAPWPAFNSRSRVDVNTNTNGINLTSVVMVLLLMCVIINQYIFYIRYPFLLQRAVNLWFILL